MKQLRQVLSLMLAICMIFGMASTTFAITGQNEISVERDDGIPVEYDGGIEIEVEDYDDEEELYVMPKTDTVADVMETKSGTDTYQYSIVHLDCGRKYFSVDSIKKIIDNAAESGFNYIELAIGNDGMRFLLDDMSMNFTANGTDYTYDSDKVAEAIHEGNIHYNNSFVSNGSYNDKVNGGCYNPAVNELTQTEMDEIIAYAYSKGVGIIPLINSPGHMHTILQAMNTLTNTENGYKTSVWSSSGYETKTSARTLDITNEVAKEFTKNFISKYIAYFASKGCTLFNLGADEYANDICTDGAMGFGSLMTNNQYGKFVTYVNEVAALIKNAGMRPIAFNDGIYFNSKTSYGTFDKDIIISYWSSGWSSYAVASASFLRGQGHSLINTHGDYYWVLGGTEVLASKTTDFSTTVFMGSNISDPLGAMFCIWCDYPGNKTEEYVVGTTKDPMAAFGDKLPETAKVSVSYTDSETDVSVTGTPDITSITVTKTNGVAVDEAYENRVDAYTVTAKNGNKEYKGVAAIKIPVNSSWAASRVKAFLVESRARTEGITELNGTYSDGYVTITTEIPATVGVYEADGTRETIYLNVGEEKTVTVEGKVKVEDDSRLETGIATATVADASVEDGITRTLGNKMFLGNSQVETITGIISDGNGHYMVVDIEGYCQTTEIIEEASVFTASTQNYGYNNTTFKTKVGNTDFYLDIGSSELNVSDTSKNVGYNSYYSNTNGQGIYNDIWNNGYTRYSIVYSNGWKPGITSSTSSPKAYLYSYTEETTVAEEKTAITFEGISAGETYVTIGDVTYTIIVETSPLTVEYWITNAIAIDRAEKTGATIAKAQASSEDGVEFSTLVTYEAKRKNRPDDPYNLVFWKGTRFTADNKQEDNGLDMTLKGDDFKYIRYWNDTWEFSADGKTWETINSDDQIVAYYLQHTDVTEEILTDVVDWGNVPYSTYPYNTNPENFVLLDYAVKYQSGERVPNSFANDNTIAYHCNYTDGATWNNSVFNTEGEIKDTYSYSANNYYRRIGMTKATETEGYEVYMITLTPSSDTHTVSDYVANDARYVGHGNIQYNGTEKVVWIDDEANLGEFADKKFESSISGKFGYRVGGDPIVEGIEIYYRQAMLVTYYVRAKATPDSLTVHYVDDTTKTEFYNYVINVDQGTVFHENIGNPMVETTIDGITAVSNGKVMNSLDKAQYVSSVLSTMPEIAGKYRYSSYKWVNIVRSEDGKDVYLYYTFNNIHDFVVDFGQPLVISKSDIFGSDSGTTYTKVELTSDRPKYGTAVIGVDEGLTYTPNAILRDVESIGVNVYENEEKDPVTHLIYIYPATNVLYEENVMSNPDSTEWAVADAGDETCWTDDVQATEVLGSEGIHGYDKMYSENTGFGGGSAYVATIEATNTQKSTKSALSFEFTGTGFDLISECGTNTGMILVDVFKKNADGEYKLNKGYFVDTYFSGDDTYIDAESSDNGILDYQVPVVRALNLEYGEYKIDIYGYAKARKDSAATASLDSAKFVDTFVADALEELGVSADMASFYEVIYMDENSVLNGGSGAEYYVDESAFVQGISLADEISALDAEPTQYAFVYIDGVRVYQTLENENSFTPAERNTRYSSIYDVAVDKTMKVGNANMVYVETKGNISDLIDYHVFGPQNEIYLTSGNTLAFELDGVVANLTDTSSIQVSAKAVTESASLTDGANNTVRINTNTEMYYNVTVSKTGDKYYLSLTCGGNPSTPDVVSISGIKLPAGVEIIKVSQEVQNEVLRVVKLVNDGEFVPAVFTVDADKSVKSGKKIYVDAQTSADVDKLIITYRGEQYEVEPFNKAFVEEGYAEYYNYSYSFKAPKKSEASEVEITVVACKAGDNSVQTAPKTLTVTIK